MQNIILAGSYDIYRPSWQQRAEYSPPTVVRAGLGCFRDVKFAMIATT